MAKLYYIFILFLLNIYNLNAQQGKDSITIQKEVIVSAFEQNKKLMDVPAAIIFVSTKQLKHFDNTSLVPALNSLAGVRMEERSPGSYRMNIRGSSLRAPFGVRNVKVYLNNIPFTDPGGNTYLNQFAFYNINQIELIKGPAGSIYGAGNGGAMLIKTTPTINEGVGVSVNFGSFGLQNYNATVNLGKGNSQNQFAFTRLKSDGYRTHTAMQRDAFIWNGNYNLSEKSSLHTILLYGDLYYQTPGGLTEAEYKANSAQARPKVGAFPSAEMAKAAIYQQTFFSGISHTYHFAKNIKNTTALYGAFSRLRNPSIRNFERRTEPHIGGRTTFTYTPNLTTGNLKIVGGAEMQNGWFSTKVYKNKNGNSDSLQTDDELQPQNLIVFAQADYTIKNWVVTVGASTNSNKISITRLSTVPFNTQTRTYKNEVSPRVAVLHKLNNTLSIYASAAKGFSPPTVAEVLPSTGVISTTLNAENGINYELGSRWQNKKGLSIDANIFQLELQNTIVLRRDLSGADYFVNAGNTKQQGIEFSASYQFNTKQNSFIHQPFIWVNTTTHNFKYVAYKQGTADFSGNRLPGVPKQTINAGVDMVFAKNFYTNFSFNYVSGIALNDANTFSAKEYYLLAARVGLKKKFAKKLFADFFATGSNLFNENYSLGNDINAAGNRFFNAAPKRNFSVGVSLYLEGKK